MIYKNGWGGNILASTPVSQISILSRLLIVPALSKHTLAGPDHKNDSSCFIKWKVILPASLEGDVMNGLVGGEVFIRSGEAVGIKLIGMLDREARVNGRALVQQLH